MVPAVQPCVMISTAVDTKKGGCAVVQGVCSMARYDALRPDPPIVTISGMDHSKEPIERRLDSGAKFNREV